MQDTPLHEQHNACGVVKWTESKYICISVICCAVLQACMVMVSMETYRREKKKKEYQTKRRRENQNLMAAAAPNKMNKMNETLSTLILEPNWFWSSKRRREQKIIIIMILCFDLISNHNIKRISFAVPPKMQKHTHSAHIIIEWPTSKLLWYLSVINQCRIRKTNSTCSLTKES